MKCFIDGNQLVITKDDFVNLQESEAFFIKLSDKVMINLNTFLGNDLLGNKNA